MGGIDALLFGFINEFKTDHQPLKEIEFEVRIDAMLSKNVCFASRIICVVLLRKISNFCQSWCEFVRFAFLYVRFLFRIYRFI